MVPPDWDALAVGPSELPDPPAWFSALATSTRVIQRTLPTRPSENPNFYPEVKMDDPKGRTFLHFEGFYVFILLYTFPLTLPVP
jgi:hypothetical protein